MILKKFYILLSAFFLASSCTHNPLDVSPKELKTPISFVNLDSILVHTAPNLMENTLKKEGIYDSDVLDYMFGHCIGIGPVEDTGTLARLQLFLKEPYVNRLEKRIASKFSDLSISKNSIRTGFSYLNAHFTNLKTPQKIVFQNSFFASNVFCTESEIAVGLERYLGEKTDVIQELPEDQIFLWVKKGMDARYLERDVVCAWIHTHLVEETNEHVAAAMIRWGKVLYLTQAAFPEMDVATILRYTAKDLKWVEENEAAFWKYLVQEKLLFSKQQRDISNFINEGPFTIGLPEKGPDRFGQYLGWKMVHSYLKENPKTPLEDLVKLPFNTILQTYEIAE